MSQDKSAKIKQAAAEDGVENPSGIGVAAAGVAYLVFVPITSYLSRTAALSTLVDGTARFIPGFNGSSSRVLPALSALYIFWTYGGSGAVSAAGQAMGRKEGLDNNHPRQHIHELRGLPLRMRSAHYGLLENFPAYALAAALAQVLAPDNREIVNLLGFHVLVKLFIYYPLYLLNIDAPRTFAHISSIGAVINVCWKLAAGAA